eukprot:GHUV01051772.1.p1 GENE.GHUV01051772.1~~GHUV01051772.1.p1  ORF type:complete len:370 (-),score=77.77 GHUV01051772.1:1193-2194(-)
MSHMPPELLRHGKQSPAGDVYAFGVMMWELYTGEQAFKNLHYGQFFESIVLNNVRPPLPPAMPADYLLLMDHCWAADPADRPTAVRLIQCIEFMILERRKSSPNPSRQSSAILPAFPRIRGGSRRSSNSTTYSRRSSASHSERRFSASTISSDRRMSERRSSAGTMYGENGPVSCLSRGPSGIPSGSGYPAVVSGLYKEGSGISQSAVSPRFRGPRTQSGVATLAGWAANSTAAACSGAGTSSGTAALSGPGPNSTTGTAAFSGPVASSGTAVLSGPGATSSAAAASSAASSSAGHVNGASGQQRPTGTGLAVSRYVGSLGRGIKQPLTFEEV